MTGGAGRAVPGMGRRIAAFDGVLAVSSPLGGPTVVTREIPGELGTLGTPGKEQHNEQGR